MSFPNIYFGVMSKNIIDAVIDVSNKNNIELGLIASRRQVDHSGGYVGFTTSELFDYVRKKSDTVYLCRDHGGPGQGSSPDKGEKSFRADVQCMDIIHIDPWKVAKTVEEGIDLTAKYIKFCNDINIHSKFEIGTEEAIFSYTPQELEFILQELERKLTSNQFGNILYATIQSGMRLDLVKHQNIGEYDMIKSIDFIETCSDFNMLPKEHNGDFLPDKLFLSLFDSGLAGINIAPEIALIESKYIWDYLLENEFYEEMVNFYKLCVAHAPWQKWMINKDEIKHYNREDACIAFGHYIFNLPEFIELKNRVGIDDYKIVSVLRQYIVHYLDLLYTEGGKDDEIEL